MAETIQYSYCSLSDGDVARIKDAIRTNQVEKLVLDGCYTDEDRSQKIGDAVIENILQALIESGNTSLTHLIISDCGMKDATGTLLAAHLPHCGITHLNLNSNKNIGNETAKAIAAVMPSSGLSHLNCCHTNIQDEGLNAIADALPTSHVISLNVAENTFSQESLIHLVEKIAENRALLFRTLDISRTGIFSIGGKGYIGDPLAQTIANALIQRPFFDQLRMLDMRLSEGGRTTITDAWTLAGKADAKETYLDITPSRTTDVRESTR